MSKISSSPPPIRNASQRPKPKGQRISMSTLTEKGKENSYSSTSYYTAKPMPFEGKFKLDNRNVPEKEDVGKEDEDWGIDGRRPILPVNDDSLSSPITSHQYRESSPCSLSPVLFPSIRASGGPPSTRRKVDTSSRSKQQLLSSPSSSCESLFPELNMKEFGEDFAAYPISPDAVQGKDDFLDVSTWLTHVGTPHPPSKPLAAIGTSSMSKSMSKSYSKPSEPYPCSKTIKPQFENPHYPAKSLWVTDEEILQPVFTVSTTVSPDSIQPLISPPSESNATSSEAVVEEEPQDWNALSSFIIPDDVGDFPWTDDPIPIDVEEEDVFFEADDQPIPQDTKHPAPFLVLDDDEDDVALTTKEPARRIWQHDPVYTIDDDDIYDADEVDFGSIIPWNVENPGRLQSAVAPPSAVVVIEGLVLLEQLKLTDPERFIGYTTQFAQAVKEGEGMGRSDGDDDMNEFGSGYGGQRSHGGKGRPKSAASSGPPTKKGRGGWKSSRRGGGFRKRGGGGRRGGKGVA